MPSDKSEKDIYEAAVVSVAKRLRIHEPISVMLDYSCSSVKVGYSFSSRRPKGSICVKLGAMVATLNNAELDAVLAHEFAHIQLGHTTRLGFFLLYKLARLRKGIAFGLLEKLIVLPIQLRQLLLGRRFEYAADALSSREFGGNHLATSLVKGAAFDVAIDLQFSESQHGSLNGLSVSNSCSAHLTNQSIAERIANDFYANHTFFVACSQHASRSDVASLDAPSIQQRIARLGFSWDEIERLCNFSGT